MGKRKPAQTQQVKSKKQIKTSKKIEDEDFVLILDDQQQQGFHEEYRKYKERKNLSCVDKNELKRDIFAPQENPAINKVSQKIVIDQETPQPLFTLKDEDPTTVTYSRFNREPFQLHSHKLEYSTDSEEEYDYELNINHQHLQKSLLGLPSERFEVTEPSIGTSTEQVQPQKKKQSKMQEEAQFKPKRQAKTKLVIAKEQKLEVFQKCLEQLQENTVPEEISCRDEEKALITKFMEDGIKNGGQSQALYISGVPGIGKTATVMELQNKLQTKKKQFQFIYANAMNFALPENIYTNLLQEITGIDKVSRNQACLLLNELFTKGHLPSQYKAYEQKMNKTNRILLLDECDYLLTPNQQVLYNLVDWPSYKQAKLTIIMIANTMDFPERLKPKLQSRLGNHRLVFKPYSSSQIEHIIQQRLNSKQLKEIFAQTTLTYIGKKIATISTDIRKTLSVCRCSIELVRDEYIQSGQFKHIDTAHIKQAYDKIYDKPYHICLRSFNTTLKLLLITIALEIHLKGYNVAHHLQVLGRFNQLSKHTQYTYEELKKQLIILCDSNLVEIKEQNLVQNRSVCQIKQLKDSLNKDNYNNINDIAISLKISIDDIKNALSEDILFKEYQQLF